MRLIYNIIEAPSQEKIRLCKCKNQHSTKIKTFIYLLLSTFSFKNTTMYAPRLTLQTKNEAARLANG